MNRAAAILALPIFVLCLPAALLGVEHSESGGARTGAAAALDEAAVRAELEDILSRPEYNRVYGARRDGVRERIGRAIERALGWLGQLLQPGGGARTGRLAALVLAWLVVIGFVALLTAIALRLARRGANRRAGAAAADPAGYDLPTAGPLIRRAALLAEQGDYRGAFRCAYLASIAYLDQARALRFDRSRTNWEYMRDLQAGGHEVPRSLLEPLTMHFDRVFFGRGDCGRHDYLDAAGAYEAIAFGGDPR